MTPFLNNSVALVTGASGGLGAATAVLLSRAGARVAALARSEDKLEKLAAGLRAEGAEAVAIAADLADFDSVGHAVARTVEAFGGIDLLVNVGGSAEGIGRRIWETPPEVFARDLAANAAGAFNLMHHAAPVMRMRPGARLAFLSSPATMTPGPATGAYAASKAAVNQLVQTLALELRQNAVAVNAFNPGPVATESWARISKVLPSGPNAPQPQPPEVAAHLPLWLCAPESEGITGEFIQWNNPNTQEALNWFRANRQIDLPAY